MIFIIHRQRVPEGTQILGAFHSKQAAIESVQDTHLQGLAQEQVRKCKTESEKLNYIFRNGYRIDAVELT